ncbi:MAG: hypothetical protein ACM3N5_10155, partial [Candidatus Eiseniibacteriota bacterium]
MNISILRGLAVVVPLGLSACASPEPATAAPSASALGVDLGSSASLVPAKAAGAPARRAIPV